MTTIPDSRLDIDTDIKRPAGGNAIGYCSTYILYVKGIGVRHDAKLVKCPYKPNRHAVFTINEMGVANLFTE